MIKEFDHLARTSQVKDIVYCLSQLSNNWIEKSYLSFIRLILVILRRKYSDLKSCYSLLSYDILFFRLSFIRDREAWYLVLLHRLSHICNFHVTLNSICRFVIPYAYLIFFQMYQFKFDLTNVKLVSSTLGLWGFWDCTDYHCGQISFWYPLWVTKLII